MKPNRNENLWILACFVIMIAIGAIGMMFATRPESPENATVPTETTVPPSKHCLEKIDINTKYNDGVTCEYYVDPTTNIVYMIFDRYDSGGITTMLHPETGKPMKLDDFYEIYTEYIPGKSENAETEPTVP